jgi:hypothetical protein
LRRPSSSGRANASGYLTHAGREKLGSFCDIVESISSIFAALCQQVAGYARFSSMHMISRLPPFLAVARRRLCLGSGFRKRSIESRRCNSSVVAVLRSIVANIWLRTLRTLSKSNSADSVSVAVINQLMIVYVIVQIDMTSST